MEFNAAEIRKSFPILAQRLKSGRRLVYFDNAATAQKPECVINAEKIFYQNDNANIHRGTYELSDRTTTEYENARQRVKNFLGAGENYELVFTSGATESLNIVAQCWGDGNLKQGDEILLSEMEHHANIVPWQFIAERKNAAIKVVKITPDGCLDLGDFEKKLSHKTKIVSISHASNVLGTINDIQFIAKRAKEVGAAVSVDAAQSAPHLLDWLDSENIDFLSLSAHKCFGPTGSGALVAKRKILDAMRPWKFGGDMIESVSWEKTTFRPSPERFEAGTPNIAGNIVFAEACKYLQSLDRQAICAHEQKLLERLTEKLLEIERVKIFGRASKKVPVVAFAVDGVHPNDIAVMLNTYGIATRTGHHCAEPLMRALGVIGTCRASLAFYNTLDEIDYFAEALRRIIALF